VLLFNFYVSFSHNASEPLSHHLSNLQIRISSCFKKLDAIRYTTHAEDSCNALSQIPEYESDIYLVQLVKLQQIAENITQNLPYDAPQSFWTSKPPIGLLVKAFQMELQSFKDSLPQKLLQDRKLTLSKPLYHLSHLP
jgi:hypothetical protein